jgi:hypothetical protein
MDENKREPGLGLLLKTERDRRKWSQNQAGSRVLLAPTGTAASWPQVTWNRLEHAGFSPIHPDWKKLANFLRLSLGQLHTAWAALARPKKKAKAKKSAPVIVRASAKMPPPLSGHAGGPVPLSPVSIRVPLPSGKVDQEAMVGLATALVAVTPLPKALHGCDRRALALFVRSVVSRAFATVASLEADAG